MNPPQIKKINVTYIVLEVKLSSHYSVPDQIQTVR